MKTVSFGQVEGSFAKRLEMANDGAKRKTFSSRAREALAMASEIKTPTFPRSTDLFLSRIVRNEAHLPFSRLSI